MTSQSDTNPDVLVYPNVLSCGCKCEHNTAYLDEYYEVDAKNVNLSWFRSTYNAVKWDKCASKKKIKWVAYPACSLSQ